MKLHTILILGAAALATPAFAADNSTPQTQTASAATASDTSSSQGAMNSNASTDASANTQTASNTASNSTASSASSSDNSVASALSSIPDTEKKYRASSRASDFAKEAQTTKQLNEQVASAGGITTSQQ